MTDEETVEAILDKAADDDELHPATEADPVASAYLRAAEQRRKDRVAR